MPGTSTDILIHVPPKLVFEVVSDFESYPEFLPDVRSVVIDGHKSKEMVATFEVKVIKTIKYTLKFKFQPPKKLTWSFVKGDLFKDNTGFWELEDTGKGNTKATYAVDVDFGLFVPKAIINMLVGNNLPAMMERFKKRAEGLYHGKK